MGRRAKHADSRDVRERKYKPLTAPERFVFAFSYIPAGRLRRPIKRPPNVAISVIVVMFVSFVAENSVRFRSFVAPVKPFPPSTPRPLAASRHPLRREHRRRHLLYLFDRHLRKHR